jgi:hypothetical protein
VSAHESTEVVITPGQAAAWSQRAERLNDLIQEVRYALASGKGSVDALLQEAQALSASHQRETRAAAGIFAPETLYAQRKNGSLSDLDMLNTPDARCLLHVLEIAQRCAEPVDRQRGRYLSDDIPLLPGEPRGTDLAETISEISRRVRTEVYGPTGGGERIAPDEEQE